MECVCQLRAGESGEDGHGCWSAGDHRCRHIAREWVWRLRERIGLATHFRCDAPCGGAVPASSALGRSLAQSAGNQDQQRPQGQKHDACTGTVRAAARCPARDPLRQRHRIHRSAAARRPAVRVVDRR